MPLEIHVEIENVGERSIFIENRTYKLCEFSPLEIRLEKGPPLVAHEGHGCAADCVNPSDESFISMFLGRWLPLPPRHFYGKDIQLYPDYFPQLLTPGRWRVQGTYRSEGNLAGTYCFMQAPMDPAQIEKLPFRSWSGRLETNAFWITILPAR
jgi:hypothetical protein